ncbi:hypothetical protein V6N13_045700 [Hibiscus sabdariffa]|uniref:Peptidase metallopeptidase domain-containing protein n=2 Tax=Hibiscus sabdariffa TaxID=183260 RepID=A0ABR2BFP5_9ROSI
MAAKLSHQLFGATLMLFVLNPFIAKSRPLKFESFEDLENVQLNKVKQFLRAYGYYPGEADQSDDRFEFDDALESALKAYQEFYSLDVTGEIDSNTIKSMSTPRCGVPDISLQQTSNYVLNPGRRKWDKFDLTYNYLSNSSQVADLDQLKQAIAGAFATWRNSSKFRFSEETTQGAAADIGISFFQGDHGDRSPFDGPADPSRLRNVLAHAAYPGSPYIFLHFDADENWSVYPTSRSDTDIESVALHEIGHNLGLAHSREKTAVMFPDYSGTRRTLDPDDIAGLTELYK